MVFVFGTTERAKQRGVIVDRCPSCLDLHWFLLLDHRRMWHLYFIPLGRGRFVYASQRCTACDSDIPFDESKFVTSLPESAMNELTIDEGLRRTQPELARRFDAIDEIETAGRRAYRDTNDDSGQRLLQASAERLRTLERRGVDTERFLDRFRRIAAPLACRARVALCRASGLSRRGRRLRLCATRKVVLGSAAMRNAGVCVCLMFALSGCGSSDSDGAAAGGGGSAGAGGSGGQLTDSGTDGAVEDAGSDAIAEGGVPQPLPEDIGFSAESPIPSGEQLLFNDWNPQPNLVLSIQPDGTGETPIFSAYRVWSMGVSHDTNTIAFACGDPLQEAHYGLTLGDAIQNTWLYDVGAQTASVLSYGNINDECHAFSADDAHIYVCRRYDFMTDNTNHTYRLGRLQSSDGAFEYLGPDLPNELELHPQPTADESAVFYTIVEVSGGKQTRRIMKKALPDGTPELVRMDASAGALSPDGTRMVFADTTQQSQLFVMNVDGSNVVKVATHPGTNPAWSPDGTKIAFLWSETNGCNHIETVLADGSQADAPFRVRDCGSAFVTDLAWIVRP